MSHPGTPRSRSRSKRSTTNLSDLRLAPLSAKFADPPVSDRPKTPRTPKNEDSDAYFSRQHPSYLQGKSAPTSPGILSRSSSRRSFGGGLSRKSEVYEEEEANDEVGYSYAGVPPQNLGGERAEFGSGQVPRAKSEATIFGQGRHHQRSLSGPGLPLNRRNKHSHGRRSGAITPKNEADLRNESWLTHTGATASAIVQQDKGLSWLASRAQSTQLGVPESEDDDDDQYEEMAALSASTAQLQLSSFDGGSPVSTRASRWGSRYGSRSQSRRTSRINSPVGTRTPRRADPSGYFDDLQLTSTEPVFNRSEERDDDEDQQEVDRLSTANSFGLGGIVDRIMNFNIFNRDEGQETTDDEAAKASDNETPEQAKERLAAELKRKRAEKAKLTQPHPAPAGEGEDGQVGGWTDAAWLLSVASKAMF